MAALGKAGLKALEALRSRLAPARVPGIQFTREVPTPRPPATPFVEKFEPAPIRVRDFDSPREVTIPMVTDQIDPVTGRQVINDVKHTIRPVPRETFDEFDELFRTNRQATILELFAEIENVESIDRLYLVTELMRRYRPQMAPRQARVLEQSLEEAAQRIGIPSQIGKMRMFTYTVPDETTVASMGRTFGGGKELLDEVNALGRAGAKTKKGDAIATVANLNKYDRGADGGILARAIMRGEAGDAADQRLIQNQINYWRRENLKKAGLIEEDFNGLRGLRYTDDMPESEMYNRTLAALQSATSEDEVAMILAQSRGRVVSPNYTDVLDDVAGRMTLDIAGGIPFDAELFSLGKHVPGAPYYIGRVEDATNVDDFFVQNPFIGPLAQSPIPSSSLLRRVGGGDISESVLRTPAPRASRTSGANIEPGRPVPSPFEELGSATSGPTGYGPVFRGLEDPFGPVPAAPRVAAGEGAGLIRPSFISKGTDVQKRWANKFAESRMQQLVSDDPAVRAEATRAMREAIRNDWVEPSLLDEMLRIVKQPQRAARGRVRGLNVSSSVDSAPSMTMPMNFTDGARGLRMAPQHSGKSTMDLILEGNRTGTTRANLGQFKKADGSTLQVGDIVEFTDNTGRKALVEITKAPYQLPKSSDPAQMDWYARTWSKYEGWDPSMYSKFVDQWQVQYRLLSS